MLTTFIFRYNLHSISLSSFSFLETKAPGPSLLKDGVPLYMVRRAAALVGPDEEAQRRFILENVDQPDSFWAEPQGTEEHPVRQPVSNESFRAPTPRPSRPSFRSNSNSSAASSLRSSSHPSSRESGGAENNWTCSLRGQPLFGRLRAVIAESAERSPHGAARQASWLGDLAAGDLVKQIAIHHAPHRG